MVGAALDVCVLPGQNRGFGGLAGFDGGEAVVSGIGPGEVLTAGVPMGPLAVIWLSEGRWVPVEPFGGGLVVCGWMGFDEGFGGGLTVCGADGVWRF